MTFRRSLRTPGRRRKFLPDDLPEWELHKRGGTHNFFPNDLSEAESSSHRFDLNGHPSDTDVSCVLALPKTANIVTGCEDGHIRVFDLAGDGNPLMDIPAHKKWVSALALLDDHVFASASILDSELHTWDAETGERLETIDFGERHEVDAIAAVGRETLIAGLQFGILVFVQHTRGRQLTEVARHERAHSDWINAIACHEDVIVTASADKTARVWSLSTQQRVAVLHGHRDLIVCTAANSQYIATGSDDKTLRVYGNCAEFPLIAVLDGLHSRSIFTVQFIGPDLVLSGSMDRTMCFTALSPYARPIARLDTDPKQVFDTVITADGQIAWVGSPGGVASVWAPPLAVAHAAKEHALGIFGSGPAAVLHLAPPPPLQGALVDANAGRIAVGEACRALLSGERCSASIAEWWCGHRLLMLAVKQGEISGKCGLDFSGMVAHNYWLKNLYLPTKRMKLRRRDRGRVDGCLAEAMNAGVIEGTEAVLVPIEAQLDVQEEATSMEDAEKQMLMALSIALLEQAWAKAELKPLAAQLERVDRVQKVPLLLSSVFRVAPLAWDATAGAGKSVCRVHHDFIARITESGIGSQGTTLPLVDRFVRQTGKVIASWAIIPVGTRECIRRAVRRLGLTWETFCDMIGKADAEIGRVDGEGFGKSMWADML